MPKSGALPATAPLERLSSGFEPWDELAAALPSLIDRGEVRLAVGDLPELDATGLAPAERERAMLVLSYIGQAYVFGGTPAAGRIPAALARPWAAVAAALGRPPILSYASDILQNWRVLEPGRPPLVQSTERLVRFRVDPDERWFGLVHVEIEHTGGPVFELAARAQDDAEAGDLAAVREALVRAATLLEAMGRTLQRMPDNCDPDAYYHRLRPFLFGWADNPSLPGGVVYEGVDPLAGKPQRFRGASAAQSPLVPAFDALLGISFVGDELGRYLLDLRRYMPPEHRASIAALEARGGVRAAVRASGDPGLIGAYDECVAALSRFRTLHIGLATMYIVRPAGGRAATGTAGTPFAAYLRAHRDALDGYRLGARALRDG